MLKWSYCVYNIAQTQALVKNYQQLEYKIFSTAYSLAPGVCGVGLLLSNLL